MPADPLQSALSNPLLARFCTRHRVATLRVFGSAVNGNFTPESDVDVVLEFHPGVDPDLFELGGMQQELTAIFGRLVDLKTPDMFSPANLRRVMDRSHIGYAA